MLSRLPSNPDCLHTSFSAFPTSSCISSKLILDIYNYVGCLEVRPSRST
ncbi:unnamed protein product, partial [Amoebophrya sp. A25]|eukprot:GSA25T00004694001.1